MSLILIIIKKTNDLTKERDLIFYIISNDGEIPIYVAYTEFFLCISCMHAGLWLITCERDSWNYVTV